jgi:hypothetical protein
MTTTAVQRPISVGRSNLAVENQSAITMSERISEIGIRPALGFEPRGVFRMLLKKPGSSRSEQGGSTPTRLTNLRSRLPMSA